MMLGEQQAGGRVARRREAVKAEIIEAAWQVAAEKGLAGLTLQDVARRVGMRAPSLYSYFDSKNALYDAMFADGYREMVRRMGDGPLMDPRRPRAAIIARMRDYMAFCRENVPRYQLLFQRTVPGFEPSPESYRVSMEAYEQMRRAMAAIGIRSQRTLDLFTAVMTGLTDQQISNDPEGDRWERLLPDAVDMFLAAARPKGRKP